MSKNVHSAQARVRMVVEDAGEFEVVQFSMDIAKNSIPKCTVLVAVGRVASTGVTPAKIHAQANNFKKMRKAFVYLEMEGEYDEDNMWPEGEFLAFEGLVEGTALAKVNGALHHVVHLVHWLAALDFASSLCQQSHTANPVEYTYRAVVSPLIKRAAIKPRGSGLSLFAEESVVSAANIKQDLWGKALKPFLYGLAQQKGIIRRGALTDCGELTGANQDALHALTRIESSDITLGLENSCFTPPLALGAGRDGVIPPAVAGKISAAITSEAAESFTNVTLWGKLVGAYASSFMFSVIPLIDRAIVVPFIPGLRDVYCKTIRAREYSNINLSGTLQRPIRVVGVFDNAQTGTGVASGQVPANLVGVGGCYAPADGDPAGMIFMTRAPVWLTGLGTSGFIASRSSGIATRAPTGGVGVVEAGNPAIRGNKDGMDRDGLLQTMHETYNAYAHAVYVSEALRGRVGEISGKLRFDIAPGSTVKIEGAKETFLEEDQLGEDLYASVMRVTVAINAEAGKAGTAFSIAFHRNSDENESDSTSVDKHPLYSTKFIGAPLIKGLDFGGCCE
jgi:hypothetical protein